MPAQRKSKQRPNQRSNQRQQELIALFGSTRRTVPLLAQARIFFGGWLNQFGWIWFAGSIFTLWLFWFHSTDGDGLFPAIMMTGFSLIGLGFIIYNLGTSIKTLRLIEYGTLIVGKLKRKTATNTSINDARVYKYTFSFIAHDGKTHEAIIKTHETYLVEDDPQELILYNPHNPAEAVVFDTIPGQPRIDQRGNILVDSILLSLGVLIGPFLSLIGVGLMVLSR